MIQSESPWARRARAWSFICAMCSGTPAPIIAYLNKALNDVVQSQDFKSRMAALGMTVPAENTPERLAAYMRRETIRQGELAALTGIKMTAPAPPR